MIQIKKEDKDCGPSISQEEGNAIMALNAKYVLSENESVKTEAFLTLAKLIKEKNYKLASLSFWLVTNDDPVFMDTLLRVSDYNNYVEDISKFNLHQIEQKV